MQIIKIIDNKEFLLRNYVEPNIIHNRFDILFETFDLYRLEFENSEFYIPVNVQKQSAKVGMYLRFLDKSYFEEFLKFLFNEYPVLQDIWVLHSYTPFGKIEAKPHWHIDLPNTKEEFDAALHSKTRYNTKWYPKKIRENIGDYDIKKYTAEEVPTEYIAKYLEWKKLSHNYEWGKAPKEYLKEAGITEVYIMATKDELLAVGFICTTEENVFFENFSYSPKYEKFSLGNVLLYYIIGDLISQNKKTFFLLGGELEYKRRYNGIKTLTYSGHIYRRPYLGSLVEKLALMLNKLPFSYRLRKKIAKLLGLFLFSRYYVRLLKERLIK